MTCQKAGYLPEQAAQMLHIKLFSKIGLWITIARMNRFYSLIPNLIGCVCLFLVTLTIFPLDEKMAGWLNQKTC